MSNNFKDNIKSSIKKEDVVSISDTNTENDIESNIQGTKKFTIEKKREDKSVKKSFPLYVDGSIQKKLDDIVKRTGYSRNELINLMINHCLDDLQSPD